MSMVVFGTNVYALLRYRLMLRRCLASPTPRFGMVMPRQSSNSTEGNDYGTMLEIKSVQMLSDGRSMVETFGAFRFRILERGTLDGYLVGRIERYVFSCSDNTPY
jgi:Lon protease-like protein